jgi:DNA-binding response OmpR family regulator
MPDPAPLPPAPGFGPQQPARTLLLVEDSRHTAEAMRLVSRRLGLRLRRVETLAAARQHLRLYRPDVVIVDLGLPDGSGLSLLADLAGAGAPPGRIVAISADPAGAEGALAAGACAFVAKPLRLPADLPALLGTEAGALPLPEAPDPLALRDDLEQARRALAEARLDYASRFVEGVARCAGDEGLARAAAQARRCGCDADLRLAIAARIGASTLSLV